MLLLCGLFFPFISYAQAPAIDWSKCYGDTNSTFGFSGIFSIIPANDGGFVALGYREWDSVTISVIKINATGDTQWTWSLAGRHYPSGVVQLKDDGFVIGGSSYDDHGLSDIWVAKLDQSGDTEWTTGFGSSLADEVPNAITATNDGGFALAGGSVAPANFNLMVVKFDAQGDTAWTRYFRDGEEQDLRSPSIIQTRDGGYAIVGQASHRQPGLSDLCVLKLTATGDSEWTRYFGGSENDGAPAIIQTTDGGFAIAGSTASNDGDVHGYHGGNGDFWILRLNASGDTVWTKCLGGSFTDNAYSIIQSHDGGFFVGGLTSSIDGDVHGDHGIEDGWVVKLNSVGDTEWTKCLGGSGDDKIVSCCHAPDGGFLLAGVSFSHDGNLPANHSGLAWIVKLAPDATNGIAESSTRSDLSCDNSPNPFAHSTTIHFTLPSPEYVRIVVYDGEGREVAHVTSGEFGEGDHEAVFDAGQLPAGVYFYRLTAGAESQMRALMLE